MYRRRMLTHSTVQWGTMTEAIYTIVTLGLLWFAGSQLHRERKRGELARADTKAALQIATESLDHQRADTELTREALQLTRQQIEAELEQRRADAVGRREQHARRVSVTRVVRTMGPLGDRFDLQINNDAVATIHGARAFVFAGENIRWPADGPTHLIRPTLNAVDMIAGVSGRVRAIGVIFYDIDGIRWVRLGDGRLCEYPTSGDTEAILEAVRVLASP